VVLVFDVDDVLIDLHAAEPPAEAALAAALVEPLGADDAARVGERFHATVSALRADLVRAPGEKLRDPRLLERMRHWQRGAIAAGHELKVWSRETWVAMALEDLGRPVTRKLVRAATDAYWDELAKASRLYEDARRVLERLKARQVPFHLATNSDGFLELDESWGTFFYDPADARARKLGRMRPLWGVGIEHVQVTVGDPIGKPHPAFYAQVLTDFGARLGRTIAPTELTVVGDSLTHDLDPFLRLGATRAVLIVRGRTPPPSTDARVQIVTALTDAPTVF
jgi:FMN phosphatase YigB (HAD superfamily)